LRQQLEQLKQDYEQKLQYLEQRIAALEKQRSQPSVPTRTTPQQSTASDLGQSVGPTYDQLQEAQTKISDLEREAKTFEFHRYLGSG
jgi:hypothetical protein